MQIANPAGAFMQGQQYAQDIRQMQRQNALADLFKKQGAGIAAGDQGAINALAQLDPMAARDITRQNASDTRADAEFGMKRESHQMGMQLDRARLQQIHQQSKLEAQRMAMEMDAQAAAAEARQIDGALSAGLAAHQQGPDAFGAFAQQYGQMAAEAGIAPEALTYENFPYIASMLIGARDGIKAGASMAGEFGATEPADEYGRYVQEERAAGREPLTRIDYAQAKKGKGTVVYDPNTGQPLVSIGGAAEGGVQPSAPESMIASIDGILNDPALDFATGWLQWTQNIPGTASRRFGARANQLEGQAFLQAFESLKGGGQITEIEGQKATQAIGRLDTAQAPEDYRQALQELRQILEDGLSRPQGWASTQAAQGDQPEARTVEIDGKTYSVRRVD